MESPPAKQFILPFSGPKKRDAKVETAAVYALADYNRSRGGGLLIKQPSENVGFIAKIGYPLWLIPKNNFILTFDGLDESSYNIHYMETLSALEFMRNLQANQSPRDKYTAFLMGSTGYFLQLPKEQEFTLKGLLANIDFRVDFNSYVREATELTTEMPLLEPTLKLNTILSDLSEMDKIQTYLKADAEMLSKILEVMHKTTNQYISEILFEETASAEEVDAKIKAQEEFIKPQIAKLTREYKVKLKDLATGYDRDIETLDKLKKKNLKLTEKVEAEIRRYEREAKLQGQHGHEIYEQRWKDKAKETQKKHAELKKELKTIEDNIKKFSKEKGQTIYKTDLELEDKIKLMRQPIVELEEERKEKIVAFKEESERLFELEKTVVEAINKSIRQRETATAGFEGLGIGDSQFTGPSLVYVPFYVICYEANSSRRYMCLSPSTVEEVDLSAKFKGAFGMSKIKDLFTPRFTSLSAIVCKVEGYSRVDSVIENQLYDLGTKNNLLKDDVFLGGIINGLSTLKEWGWLSERETAELSGHFAP